MHHELKSYNFSADSSAGMLICCGGFENRATTFVRKISRKYFRFQKALLLHYESQRADNQANFSFLSERISELSGHQPDVVKVDSRDPNKSFNSIAQPVMEEARKLKHGKAVIDISGMSQMLAVATIHACYLARLEVTIVYTEARSYFPTKSEGERIARAWEKQDYLTAARYLQSQGLKSISILPEFAGNIRPRKPMCLIIFIGYEPNRIQGLVQYYSPDRVVAIYGRSPHEKFLWRGKFSHRIHRQVFEEYPIREIEASTLKIGDVLESLEREFDVIKEEFDVAIAPQCSKLQAVSSYLFWRQHPEVQLVFTTPVRFNPNHYSRGAGVTLEYLLPEVVSATAGRRFHTPVMQNIE